MTDEKADGEQLDHLFSNSAARMDRWRDLNAKAQAWVAGMRGDKGQGSAPVLQALAAVRPMERYFAYPGAHLLRVLDERIADDDPKGAGRLVSRMSNALLSGRYRYETGEWAAIEDASAEAPDRTPPGLRAESAPALF